MGINYGRGHILVAQQLLDGADVVPYCQQVRGERMSQHMGCRWLGDLPGSGRQADRLLHSLRMKVVAPNHSGTRIR